ncbi:retrotransposon protein, putative, ty1-copia subclass [Tanacetum coccineum]|uniref:Retrotransposon protein, putative, ty1-copia subclass n=1 Tax=Tanacetum coccineum TaxID=301880 RepID=A0ABQ5F1H1_9ASTR
MNFIDHDMEDLHDIDIGLIMASQPRCETSVEYLKHCLPWLSKVLGEESTDSLKWSLIAKDLEKWPDVIKISRWDEWLFKSFYWKLKSCTEHVHSVCDFFIVYHETDCLISIGCLLDCPTKFLNVDIWNTNSRMERGFLSQKGSGSGRGVKEKNVNTDSSMQEGDNFSGPTAHIEATSLTMNMAMENQSSLVDTTGLGSYPPLPKQVATLVDNAPSKPSYANVTSKYGLVRSIFSSSTGIFSFKFSSMDGLDAMLENGPWFIRNNPLILKKWNPGVNLLKEDVSTVSVWVKLHGVPVTTFSEDGLSAIATKLGTPLMLDSYTSDTCMQSWGRSSYDRAMIELRADVKLKDNIVVAMPRVTGEGHYTCAGETKKTTSQAHKGIPVGPKVGFKPSKEYRSVSKKHSTNSSSNKKQDVDSTNNVSDLNPFEVLNSVCEDGTSTTPIMYKIGKFENLIIDGQAILVDETVSPLKKVEYQGDHDSEDEVASVDNDMARSMASEMAEFGTHSFLEQWRDSYGNGDYDENPYDDDMYEGHDLTEEIQTICDKLDIRVRGRKKLATLPFTFGRLGVYSAGDVLNYAFLASRLQSASLQTKLLRHTGIVSPGPIFNDALSVFNTSMKTDLLSNPSKTAVLKLMKKMTDIYFTQVTKNAESTFSLSPRQMALWTSQKEDHTSDWLRMVPISGLGQTMNGKTYRCVLCYRLGISLFSVSKPCSACSRVFTGDIYGDNAVSCAGIIGIKHCHNVVRDNLVDICYRSGILAGKEVDIGLDERRDKPLRPADMLLYSWDEGLDVYVELTGSSPLTQTGMVDFVPGQAVIDAAQRKREADAVTLPKRIRKFSMTQDIGARDAAHIFNRIRFAIAKGVGPR